MQNCKNCKPIRTKFDTIGKTYYLFENDNILCFKHWYQAGKPKYLMFGEYDNIIEVIRKQKKQIEELKSKLVQNKTKSFYF